MNKELKETMIKVTVNCMLNPNNKDFYIGTLTFDKLHNLIDNDSDKAEVVFTALGIAQAEFDNDCAYIENALIDDIICEYAKHGNFSHYGNIEHIWLGCPECGCSAYIDGCHCPNCDYED